MGKTLEQQKEILNIQYVLESLIEYYDTARKESDRYYIKGQLLEFINDFNVSLDFVKNYMSLQPEKFDPFIKTLSSITCKDKSKVKSSYFDKNDIEIRTYICRK